jgi:hypothetical protein
VLHYTLKEGIKEGGHVGAPGDGRVCVRAKQGSRWRLGTTLTSGVQLPVTAREGGREELGQRGNWATRREAG